MHLKNELRLLAGLVIDPEFEKTKVVETAPLVERDDIDVGFPITKGGKHRFILVQGAGPDSTLEDIISEVDTLALVDIARGAGAKGPGQEGWELFPVNKKAEAMALAERRLEKAQVADPVGAPAEQAPVTEAKKADKDYDKDGEVETSEEEHRGAVDKAIKQNAKDARSKNKNMDKTQQQKDKLAEGKKADKDYDKDGEVESSEDEHKGVVDKAIKKEKKEDKKDLKEMKQTPQPIVDTGKENLYNTFNDKDENPDPNKDEQSIAKGNEACPCPAKLLIMLKKEIGEAEKEAEYYEDRDQSTSNWYGTLATAMGTLHHCLSQGTVEHMQRAQIEFSSWMNMMQHKVPSEVVDFIMKGGKTLGLKDFYKEVKVRSAEGADPSKKSYVK